MNTITNTLSSSAISTVFSKKKFNQHLRTNNLSRNNITEFTIPNGITKIGARAFSNCSSLTSITIPDGVTKISYSAFNKCINLKKITIPASVKEIGDIAFLSCTNLTSINIPDGVTTIAEGAFDGCTSLKSITIPGSVTEIAPLAFMDCSSLASITIPSSVTEIGYNAFSYCKRLQSIAIPNSVTKIGGEAFKECTNLAVIICNNPGQFDRDDIGIDTYQTQFISYEHAKLLTANNLIDLKHNEAYLIYRMISEPGFNPGWAVIETTFNARSLPQIKSLLQSLDKKTDHLPKQIIMFEDTMIPAYFEEFLSIAHRSSLFGPAERTIDIMPQVAPAAHH